MEKYFLYHRVPEEMTGNILYPLNRLKEKMPHLYTKTIAKYEGREYLLDDIIPILNCKWNDVLHMTAVHPGKLMKALRETGHNAPIQKFFQIDASQLSQDKTVIYWYRQDKREQKFQENNFEIFNMSKVKDCDIIPPETIEYFNEQYELRKRPLLFFRIPHILYQGPINTGGLPVTEV